MLSVIMVNGFILSVITLSVAMLNVAELNVVMLIVFGYAETLELICSNLTSFKIVKIWFVNHIILRLCKNSFCMFQMKIFSFES
jgi:hypothetical protein